MVELEMLVIYNLFRNLCSEISLYKNDMFIKKNQNYKSVVNEEY